MEKFMGARRAGFFFTNSWFLIVILYENPAAKSTDIQAAHIIFCKSEKAG